MNTLKRIRPVIRDRPWQIILLLPLIMKLFQWTEADTTSNKRPTLADHFTSATNNEIV